VLKAHASEPLAFDNPSAADVAARGKGWLQRWTKTVLK
jgi:thiamine transport system substrate-binding protein